MRRTSVLQ